MRARASSDDFGADEEIATFVEDPNEKVFGRYQLVYQLALGGMGTVYLARVQGPGGFDRPVAIKRIHAHLASTPHFIEMFLDEARIVSRITHPNVCSIYDFGAIDGVYYLAMEYLTGETLSAVAKQLTGRPELVTTPRWQAFVLRMISEACEGLHAAHELRDESGRSLGVVHRDVSPQNLFVTYDGALKVVDFGVAYAHDRIYQTRTGTVRGKLAYIAPEQLAGEPIDRRADVWALGVCAWELFTGQRLFRRDTELETAFALRSDAVPAPSSINPTLDPEIDRVVLGALERDLERRTPNARALAQQCGDRLTALGVRMSLADAAEIMSELFVASRSRKLELLEEASQPSDEPATVVDAMPPTAHARNVTPSPETVTAAPRPLPAQGSAEELATLPRLAPAKHRSADRLVLALGIAIVALVSALAGVAVVGLVAMGRRPDEASVVLPEGSASALVVQTEGGEVEVYEGERRLGSVPGSISLSPGRHTLTFRPSGRTITIDAPPSGNISLSAH